MRFGIASHRSHTMIYDDSRESSEIFETFEHSTACIRKTIRI